MNTALLAAAVVLLAAVAALLAFVVVPNLRQRALTEGVPSVDATIGELRSAVNDLAAAARTARAAADRLDSNRTKETPE